MTLEAIIARALQQITEETPGALAACDMENSEQALALTVAALVRAIAEDPETVVVLAEALDDVMPALRGETVACEHGSNDKRYWPLESSPGEFAGPVLAALVGRGS